MDKENHILRNVYDKIAVSDKKFTESFTGFFDPAMCRQFMMQLTKESHIKEGFSADDYDGYTYVNLLGGYDGFERAIIGINVTEESHIPIKILNVQLPKIRSNNKIITHRDYLGSILGLSINRDKIGDIIVRDDGAYIIVKEEISEFIYHNLERVGRTNVQISFCDRMDKEASYNHSDIIKTVSSLRLDAVLAGVFNLSREKVKMLILAEKVALNYKTETSIAKHIKEGDKISLRGYGKIILKEVKGTTRKDRIAVVITKL